MTISKNQRRPLCKLIINRTELQEVIFPLIIPHKIKILIESRNDQFNLAMYIFIKNIKNYDDIKNLNLTNISTECKS